MKKKDKLLTQILNNNQKHKFLHDIHDMVFTENLSNRSKWTKEEREKLDKIEQEIFSLYNKVFNDTGFLYKKYKELE